MIKFTKLTLLLGVMAFEVRGYQDDDNNPQFQADLAQALAQSKSERYVNPQDIEEYRHDRNNDLNLGLGDDEALKRAMEASLEDDRGCTLKTLDLPQEELIFEGDKLKLNKTEFTGVSNFLHDLIDTHQNNLNSFTDETLPNSLKKIIKGPFDKKAIKKDDISKLFQGLFLEPNFECWNRTIKVFTFKTEVTGFNIFLLLDKIRERAIRNLVDSCSTILLKLATGCWGFRQGTEEEEEKILGVIDRTGCSLASQSKVIVTFDSFISDFQKNTRSQTPNRFNPNTDSIIRRYTYLAQGYYQDDLGKLLNSLKTINSSSNGRGYLVKAFGQDVASLVVNFCNPRLLERKGKRKAIEDLEKLGRWLKKPGEGEDNTFTFLVEHDGDSIQFLNYLLLYQEGKSQEKIEELFKQKSELHCFKEICLSALSVYNTAEDAIKSTVKSFFSSNSSNNSVKSFRAQKLYSKGGDMVVNFFALLDSNIDVNITPEGRTVHFNKLLDYFTKDAMTEGYPAISPDLKLFILLYRHNGWCA